MCTYPVQPICTFSCTSVFILIFINPQYTVLHILSLHILLHILLFVPIFILTYIYIYSLVLCFIVFYFVLYFIFNFFALSIERTCPDLHFTTDYTLYDCVCDK